MMRCASIELQKALMGMESRKHCGYSGVYNPRTTAFVFLPLLCAYHYSRTRGASRVETSPRCLATNIVQATRFSLSVPSNVCFMSEGGVPRTIARRKSGAT
jgi:hypothetical protein